MTRIVPAGPEAIAEAARLLESGRIAAIPTETVYGLAADATNGEAVAKIYAAKGRPSFNPLIAHVDGCSMAARYAEISPLARDLMRRFWPVPLTLVLPLKPDSRIAPIVTAGLSTIALRAPDHRIPRALIAALGAPLAAPSANKSGAITATTAEHVAQAFGDEIAAVIDGGPTGHGLESTIVAVEEDSLRLLRPGPVTAAELAEIAPVSAGGGKIEAPGMLSSHYAPAKPLRLGADAAEEGEYMIGFADVAGDETLSAKGDLAEAAANLFAALHRADASAKSRIAVAAIPAEGLGAAINDRLRRAAA